MAGIGFELKKLAQRRGMLAPVASLGHATVIAAGPWLLTVIALSITQSRVTLDTEWRSNSVQALIIYCFCVSLVVTAPITALAVRLASDRLYLRRFETLVPIFLWATLACVLAGFVGGIIVFAGMMNMAADELSLALLSCCIVSAMWPAMAFAGTVRRYGSISRAFLLGLGISVTLTFAAEKLDLSAAKEAFAFSSGLAVTTILLQGVVLSTFAGIRTRFEGVLPALRQGHSDLGFIALGALFSALALWADTCIMWLSPLRIVSPEGLATAPFYDSVMFIARISMVPALAFFIIWVETSVFDRVTTYIAAIRGTGTLDRILRAASDLRGTISHMMTSVILVQLVASCALALLAHAAIDLSGLLYQQTGLLRNGAIGALFHMAFLASTTILLFLDRPRSFAALQGLFLVLNTGLTYVVMVWAPEFYGFGYLLAAAICATIAVIILESRIQDITSATFAEAQRVAAASRRSAALVSRALKPFGALGGTRLISRVSSSVSRKGHP